jgi:hypothetical protein
MARERNIIVETPQDGKIQVITLKYRYYRGPARGCAARIKHVSVYEDRRDELEIHEFMMGVPRGRLAVTLDVLTDARVLVGQHGVYCQSARQPGRPAMDIQLITKSISDAKDLISGVMSELKTQRQS